MIILYFIYNYINYLNLFVLFFIQIIYNTSKLSVHKKNIKGSWRAKLTGGQNP